MSLDRFQPVTAYGTPDYAKIQAGDFPAALAEAREKHRAEILAIVDEPAPASFENTLLPWARAGRDYGRVMSAFSVLTLACRTEELSDIETQDAPKAAEHQDTLYMFPGLWDRLQAVHARGREGCPSAEAWRLVEQTLDAFRRQGAHLNAEEQARLRLLNQEEASLAVAMTQRIQAAREDGVLVQENELDGLDGDLRQGLERIDSNTLRLPLDNTTIQDSLAQLQSADTRRKVWEASCSRNLKGERDTRPLLTRLDRVRAERAKLLGFDSHAHLVLDPQQTKTPERMETLLKTVGWLAVEKAREEARLLELASGTQGLADRAYHERVFGAQTHSLDEAALRPYFSWDRVLHDGLFRSAQVLYGLTFTRTDSLPLFHADVTAYEVTDEAGKAVGLFLVDPWERLGKNGGAWMCDLVAQNHLHGDLPVATNHLNLRRPPEGQPALMSLDEVQTAFHEFGHALHGLLSQVTYPALGSLSVPTDFVELPSQIHEHWMLHPDLLPHYAKHVDSGEPLPENLVKAIRDTRQFGQGYAMAEVTGAAWLDLQWHQRGADAGTIETQAVTDFEREAMVKGGFDTDITPPRYSTPYFNHIWGGGYGASYGAYVASAVLECDGFAWFEEHGGMTRENGRHFANTVLGPGHTQPVDVLYRNFRGRDPDIAPLLQDRGLVAGEAAPRKKARVRA